MLIENLIRAPDSPNGTVELLIDSAMREAAQQGSGFVTLGLGPLTGKLGCWLRVAKFCGSFLYNFSGLERFKAKFLPDDWSPIYLAFPQQQSAAVAVYDTLATFAGGSLIRFGIRTILRHVFCRMPPQSENWAHRGKIS